MSLLSKFATTVTLLVPTVIGEDALGEPVTKDEPVEITGCLVANGTQSGPTAERPQGLHDAKTVYLKAAGLPNMRLAKLVIGGRTYHVIGDPTPYPGSPVGWDTVVELEADDG